MGESADRLSISACGHKTKTDRRKKMQKMSAPPRYLQLAILSQIMAQGKPWSR